VSKTHQHIEIRAGRYRLELIPAIGGGVSAFEFDGEPLFRPAINPQSALDMACYPLVPFSNRIRDGRFIAHGREIRLKPNFPGSDHPHTLHGQGWLAAWHVVEYAADRVTIAFDYQPDDWPWAYHAEQRFELSEAGLILTMTVANLAETAMPAGLGPHPFFPMNKDTRLIAKHRIEWTADVDSLPVSSSLQAEAIDWWGGKPVGSRAVDTIYGGREGLIRIEWPDRHLALMITPDPALDYTVIYTQPDTGFFCAEPVSHMIDAHNLASQSSNGLVWLQQNDHSTYQVIFKAEKM
jgi:aldose 1-epimerase